MAGFIPAQTREYYEEVSFGRVPEAQAIVVNSGTRITKTPEDGILGGGFFPTSPEQYSLVSDSTDEASAGTGLRTVQVRGLDSNWEVQFETVTLNGTTPVLTTNSYLRFTRVIGLTAGSGQRNAGTITVTGNTSTETYGTMDPGDGLTRSGIITTPLNTVARLVAISFNLGKLAGSGSGVFEFESSFRNNNNPEPVWLNFFKSAVDASDAAETELLFPLGDVFGDKTDFEVRYLSTNGRDNIITARFFIVLEQN